MIPSVLIKTTTACASQIFADVFCVMMQIRQPLSDELRAQEGGEGVSLHALGSGPNPF